MNAELSSIAQNYCSSYKPSHQALKKHSILKRLRNNKNIVICKPDKGNSVVILDRTVYNQQMLEILGDKRKFVKRNKLSGGTENSMRDLTLFREDQLKRFLYSLKSRNLLEKSVYHDILPQGSVPARLYGLPKMHKVRRGVPLSSVVPPFRPIVSSIGTYNYKLAKFLTDQLSPHISMEHCAVDTFSFVEDIKKVSSKNQFMVSFDVVSLFTSIPLDETIDLAVNLLMDNEPSIKMSKKQLKKLFHFATAQTHFMFNGDYYDQVDGVAMGSPLGPVLANLFMSHHEKIWLSKYQGPPVKFYKRYVDDIFCLFDHKDHAKLFLEYLNKQHACIKFTLEEEENSKLPFLDVLISKLGVDQFHLTTYRKPTNTGLLTNFTSFCSYSYKIGLIKTLVDRVHKINSDIRSRDLDLSFVSTVLQKNQFPLTLIKRVMSEYKSKASNIANDVQTTNPSDNNIEEVRYYKLPYIGKFSSITRMKIRRLLQRFCSEKIDAKFIFETCKIGSYFSTKDPVPKCLINHVVYHFKCAGCNACYIGETARHYQTRIDEHLFTDKDSAVYKHLHKTNNTDCKSLSTYECFSILDRAPTKFKLRLKEAHYVRKYDPVLNKQVKSYQLKLLV